MIMLSLNLLGFCFFCHTFFTFILVTIQAFIQNASKNFITLKLATENLLSVEENNLEGEYAVIIEILCVIQFNARNSISGIYHESNCT